MSFFIEELGQAGEDVDRQREDDGRVLLDADFGQRLEITKLQRGRLRGENVSRIRQSLRRRELALGVNQLRPLLALGLGLLGHRAQHRLRQIDLLDFHVRHFHAPRLRVLVEDGLDARVERVAMREELVELDFAEDGAKRRLRKLRRLIAIVEHFDDGAPRLDHAQENDRVHFQRDVVARDDVLRRNFERFLPQRHAHDAIDRREHQKNAGSLRLGEQTAETEDHAAFVLGEDFDRAEKVETDDDDDDEQTEIQGALRADAWIVLLLGGLPYRFNSEMQAVHARHPHSSPLRDRAACDRVPQLPVNEDFAARPERRSRDSDLPDHPFFAGDDRSAARFQNQRHQEDRDHSERDAHSGGGDDVHAHLRNRSIDEKQRADDHAHDATDGEHAVRRELRLEREERERHQQQRQRGETRREKIEREQRQHDRDYADHTGNDGAGMVELRENRQAAQHQKKERDV